MDLRSIVWNDLAECKSRQIYLELRRRPYQRLERGVNVTLAVASSTSIAGWAIWKDDSLALLWGGIIAFSQVVSAVRPFFPFDKTLKEIGKRSIQLAELSLSYEILWFEIDRLNDLSLNERQEELFAERVTLRKRMFQISSFPDDVTIDFKAKNQYSKRAKEEAQEYLQTLTSLSEQ